MNKPKTNSGTNYFYSNGNRIKEGDSVRACVSNEQTGQRHIYDYTVVFNPNIRDHVFIRLGTELRYYYRDIDFEVASGWAVSLVEIEYCIS